MIRNSDIQGMGSGIDAPSSGMGPGANLTVENSILRNWDNINVPTPSSVNGCWMENMLHVVKNTQLQAPPGRSLSAIGMDRAIGGAIECLSKQVEVRVYGYNGNATDNFQIYHSNGSVMPRPPGSCTPTTRTGIDGLTCTIAPLGGHPADRDADGRAANHRAGAVGDADVEHQQRDLGEYQSRHRHRRGVGHAERLACRRRRRTP